MAVVCLGPAPAAANSPSPALRAERTIGAGDRAARAGDHELALSRYRAVLEDDPRNALAHYRVGQVHALRGDPSRAEPAYFAALRFAGADDALRAKVLFCIADLRERRRALDAAAAAWTEYEKQGATAPETTPHTATAAERKNRIVEWNKVRAAASETRARTSESSSAGPAAAPAPR